MKVVMPIPSQALEKSNEGVETTCSDSRNGIWDSPDHKQHMLVVKTIVVK